MSAIPLSPTVRFDPKAERIKTLNTFIAEKHDELSALDADKSDEIAKIEKAADEATAELEKVEALPDPPVYTIAVPNYRTKAAWTEALIENAVVFPSDRELLTAIKSAVEDGWSDFTVPEVQVIIDEIDALPAGETPSTESREKIDEMRDATRGFRAVARLVAARFKWHRLAPYLAAQHFLVDITPPKGGAAPAIKKRCGVVSDETLAEIDEAHIRAIGDKALSLFTPTKDQEKN